MGGSYRNLFASCNPGDEVHHMPAEQASTSLHKNDGPAINLPYADHFQTKSYGNMPGAIEYRRKQHELIVAGKFEEAQQMDFDDLRQLFGNKYDDAIKQCQEYTKTIKYSKRSGMPLPPSNGDKVIEKKRHAKRMSSAVRT